MLRKHLKGCSGRIEQDLAMPQCLSVGKKVTACDQCARSKRACDSNLPRSTCAGRKYTCTYERQLCSLKQTDQRTPVTSNTLDDNGHGSDFNYDFLDDMSLPKTFSFQIPTDGLELEYPTCTTAVSRTDPPNPNSEGRHTGNFRL